MTLLRSILGHGSIRPMAWCEFMGLPLKTGQTTQYSSKEDDGFHQKGLGRDYTILTAGQYGGTSAITVNSKTVNLSNNCVLDNRTGLMWTRYVPTTNIGPDSNGKLLWLDDVNNEDIFDFCDQANAEELGGYTDWRVPNVFEYFSLVNNSVTGPTIDGTVFPSSPTGNHWTSTTMLAATTYAFTIYFTDGQIKGDVKATGKNYCRLVRGGTVPSPNAIIAGPLLKTGQTTQYDGKLDDGYFEKGLSRDYTVLDSGQYAGTTNITLNSKTHALSNNCVIDNRTGLMWARYMPNADIGPDSDGKLLGVDDVNNEDIYDFAAQANTQALGGHTDWRVPNFFEVVTLLVCGGTAPFIDKTVFPSTPSDFTWSSTRRPDVTTRGMIINFANTMISATEVATSKIYCRLVRG